MNPVSLWLLGLIVKICCSQNTIFGVTICLVNILGKHCFYGKLNWKGWLNEISFDYQGIIFQGKNWQWQSHFQQMFQSWSTISSAVEEGLNVEIDFLAVFVEYLPRCSCVTLMANRLLPKKERWVAMCASGGCAKMTDPIVSARHKGFGSHQPIIKEPVKGKLPVLVEYGFTKASCARFRT